MEKVKRMTLCAKGSSAEWSKDGDDDNLRKDVIRNAGGTLSEKTIDKVMAGVNKLAVRTENSMIFKIELHNMHQDRDELVRNFVARLRGEANICSFLLPCPSHETNVVYT